MNSKDKEVIEWMENHAHELTPEELPTEEEKIFSVQELWPKAKPTALKRYSNIITPRQFNNIIGNPKNWMEILQDKKLFNEWVAPQAILMFGKVWFDRVKWKPNIGKGIPFGLFTEEERQYASNFQVPLEHLPSGKIKILKIIEKTKHALLTYLKRKGNAKAPSGYIVESIKNCLVRYVGKDLGFKLETVPVCPYCISKKYGSYKTVLTRYGTNEYSCFRCTALSNNIKLQIEKEKDRKKLECLGAAYKLAEAFKRFSAITCVCPRCNSYVPLTCTKDISDEIIASMSVLPPIKGNKVFRKMPSNIQKLTLDCPFCFINFHPKNITGLPTISVWRVAVESFEDKYGSKEISSVNVNPQLDINQKQKINILIDEIILHISSIKGNKVDDLLRKYFYLASIRWINIYWKDAARYFFGGQKRVREMTEKEQSRYLEKFRIVTDVPRGQEMAIHQSFFKTWMDLLEENISVFTDVNSSIKALEDFPWFCHPPKFNGGPRATFIGKVDSCMKVKNETPISSKRKGDPKPRLARLLNFAQEEGKISCMDHVKACEWQAIRLHPMSSLRPGTTMRVEALFMPGHPTHAPIQRILRLRRKVLSKIIEKIQEEEKTGVSDVDFWRSRKKLVDEVKPTVDLTILGEKYARAKRN